MKQEQFLVKKKLTIVFWLNLIIFLGLAFTLLYTIGIDGKSETEQDFIWERFGIIIIIAIIPLSLKLFHKKHKDIASEDIIVFLKKLQQIFLLRLLALDIAILLNFVGFYFIGALNFMYMAVIAIFVFIMCYPTESMIDPVVVSKENQSENNENKI